MDLIEIFIKNARILSHESWSMVEVVFPDFPAFAFTNSNFAKIKINIGSDLIKMYVTIRYNHDVSIITPVFS